MQTQHANDAINLQQKKAETGIMASKQAKSQLEHKAHESSELAQKLNRLTNAVDEKRAQVGELRSRTSEMQQRYVGFTGVIESSAVFSHRVIH